MTTLMERMRQELVRRNYAATTIRFSEACGWNWCQIPGSRHAVTGDSCPNTLAWLGKCLHKFEAKLPSSSWITGTRSLSAHVQVTAVSVIAAIIQASYGRDRRSVAETFDAVEKLSMAERPERSGVV